MCSSILQHIECFTPKWAEIWPDSSNLFVTPRSLERNGKCDHTPLSAGEVLENGEYYVQR